MNTLEFRIPALRLKVHRDKTKPEKSPPLFRIQKSIRNYPSAPQEISANRHAIRRSRALQRIR